LRQAVHAPGCKTVKICPNQCSCRYQRTFKLNTETAACWQIADNLLRLISSQCIYKKDCIAVISKASAYYEIARFHMSKGWERFFDRVRYTLKNLTEIGEDAWYGQDGVTVIEKMIPRLKRYPKD